MAQCEPCPILVVGDVTADWMVAEAGSWTPNLQAAYRWQQSGQSAFLSVQAGGAALLAALVRNAAPEQVVHGPAIPAYELANPQSGAFPKSFSRWQQRPCGPKRPELVWRMHEFLGLRGAVSLSSSLPAVDGPVGTIVIDDAALGFRSQETPWPEHLAEAAGSPAIIHKMAAPLCTGPLWEALIARHADRLTIYVSLGDFRRSDASIGQALSWEQLAGDIVRAVSGHPDLSRARRVVVSVGYAGAVVVERDRPATLVFDPDVQEGDWESRHPGLASGLGTCIAAALAIASAESDEDRGAAAAVARGLAAGRAAHIAGYLTPESGDSLEFPLQAASAALQAAAAESAPFAMAPIDPAPGWQLLPVRTAADYRNLAEAIVLDGKVDAFGGLPIERMGNWMSIDRTEIESVRSLRNITNQYLNHTNRARPLSLAVFGAPGSGKSFAVKQMAREWSSSGVRIDVLEFNVAQFGTPEDLGRALQRVRDSAVQQVLPLVFWDEFDSPFGGREYGWLARFLAPMQDGIFLDDGQARPIGQAIFVFAGGTQATLAGFVDAAVAVPGSKATDFLSRLRGHIDVLGPNPRDSADLASILRRALLLRSVIAQRAPHLQHGAGVSIDPGVLRAFLEVPRYVHGARSMEAIVEMSALAGRLRFERAALPARHQLAMHVDADAFVTLAQATTT